MSEESLKTSKKLGALSKNLLDYIKLQHKESASLTRMELVAAHWLVFDVLELFSSVAAFHQVRLQNEVAGSFEVYSDQNLLSIIIHNLIDNALKIGSTEVVVSSGKAHGRKQNIFRPLGMDHTLVNQITARNKERAIGYDLFGNENNYDSFIGGTASVVSTVRDLFKWDESFVKSPLVNAQTLAEAFEPSIVQKDDTYGPLAVSSRERKLQMRCTLWVPNYCNQGLSRLIA